MSPSDISCFGMHPLVPLLGIPLPPMGSRPPLGPRGTLSTCLPSRPPFGHLGHTLAPGCPSILHWCLAKAAAPRACPAVPPLLFSRRDAPLAALSTLAYLIAFTGKPVPPVAPPVALHCRFAKAAASRASSRCLLLSSQDCAPQHPLCWRSCT